jgi:cell division protein FtsL
MRFVLLVLGMLGGSLVCLLVINTTLGASSFEIDHLQQQVAARSLQVQSMQQQVAAEGSPQQIEQEAAALGMRGQAQMNFLDLAHGGHIVVQHIVGRRYAKKAARSAR